jgi:hypothetical protein
MNHRFRLSVWLAAFVFSARLSGAGSEPVCFEAESATKIEPPMELVREGARSDADSVKALKEASGHCYLEIAEGKGNPPKVTTGSAAFAFEIAEPGDYILWCRVWWGDECGNSFTMKIDAAVPFSFGQDATYKSWHWVKSASVQQLSLSKGRHTLEIHNREDGVRVDQVLLVKDRRYVPVDIEPVTSGEQK